MISIVFFPGMPVFAQNDTDITKNSTLFPVKWNHNASHIEFELTYGLLEWIALGFSHSQEDRLVDLVTLSIPHNGARGISVKDYWIGLNGTVTFDLQQDWSVIETIQNKTVNMTRITRRRVTCDHQDLPIFDDTINLLYMTGSLLDTISEGMTLNWTSATRVKTHLLSLPFEADIIQAVKDDPNSGSFDLMVDKVIIPAGIGRKSHCALIKLPALTQKYHAVAITPIISKGSENIFQRSIAYFCSPLINDTFPTKDFDCSAPENLQLRDALRKNCTIVLGVVGSGSDTFYLPKEAGISITPEMNNRYIFLQNDYHNENSADFEDSSGMSLVISSDIRQYDAGIIALGYADQKDAESFAIHTNVSDLAAMARCPSTCTEAGITRRGAHFAGILFDAGASGRRMMLRQIRNGTELSPISEDNHYDSAFQQALRPSSSRMLLRGDELILQCQYSAQPNSNSSETNISEICRAFVTIYPVLQPWMYLGDVGLTVCSSSAAVVNDTMGIQTLCTSQATASGPVTRTVTRSTKDFAPFFGSSNTSCWSEKRNRQSVPRTVSEQSGRLVGSSTKGSVSPTFSTKASMQAKNNSTAARFVQTSSTSTDRTTVRMLFSTLPPFAKPTNSAPSANISVLNVLNEIQFKWNSLVGSLAKFLQMEQVF